MIYLYSGKPGSGKSLHVARDILIKLNMKKKKNKVIANFPVNLDMVIHKENFTYVDNSQLTVNFLIQYAFNNHIEGVEGQTLLVVDECHVLWNARDFNSKSRMEWLKFFSQHRKLGYNIILVSQGDRQIDRQIRLQIEYDVKHRKLNNFGFMQFVPIPFFIAVTYWYGVNEKMDIEMFSYKKKYGSFYDSYKMFDTTLQVVKKEKKA